MKATEIEMSAPTPKNIGDQEDISAHSHYSVENDNSVEDLEGGDSKPTGFSRGKQTSWQAICEKISFALCPFLMWCLPWRYGFKKHLRGDIMAGVTVAAMLVPQGISYALVAGMPPIYGLYASVFPALAYSFFATSRQLSVAPVAIVSLLTNNAVSALVPNKIGDEYNPEYITLAITLAMLSGFIQLILGLARLGFLVNFLSHPVISAFTSAAAIIIGMSQMKHVLGYSIEKGTIYEVLISMFSKIDQTHWPSLLMAAITTIVLYSFKKAPFKLIRLQPTALYIVVVATLITWAASLQDHGVKILKDVPAGLPTPAMPSFDNVVDLLLPAFMISLIGYMESIAVAKTYAEKEKYEVDANKELIGLGAANLLGSLFKAYPTTGGFSRTAVNYTAGARTPLASVLTSIFLMFILLVATPLFYYLPKPILGPIVIVAVIGLIDTHEPRYLWKVKRKEFLVWVVTFLATLFVSIEGGIATGVVISLGIVLHRAAMSPHWAILGRLPGTDVYRNRKRYENLEYVRRTVIFRYDADLFFANSTNFRDIVNRLMKGDKPNYLPHTAAILDFSGINDVDSSALHMIKNLFKSFEENHQRLLLANVKGPVRDSLLKQKVCDTFHHSIAEAVEVLEQMYRDDDIEDLEAVEEKAGVHGDHKILEETTASQSSMTL